MDAVEFLKEAQRYCRWCKNTTQDGKKRLCEVCYFEKLNDIFNLHPMAYHKFVEMIEQWAKAHPVKTRQSQFLKMFPHPALDSDGVIAIQPCEVIVDACKDSNDNKRTNCWACRRDFWLKEIE